MAVKSVLSDGRFTMASPQATASIKIASTLNEPYQEVFLKNGNSGAAAGKEERAIET